MGGREQEGKVAKNPVGDGKWEPLRLGPLKGKKGTVKTVGGRKKRTKNGH